MSKKMLINASHPEENRVAIVVDGILSELDIEIAGQEQGKGNIYKAVVVRVESGLQAAFVDYGAEKLGFLQIGEIHPNLYPNKLEGKSRPRISDILHRGKEILVQIVKEERGNKGAALTTYLSLPGRYMVLMPDSTTKGVSRKIQDDSERKKLKKTMAELNLPERMGYIVRTAGIGKEKEELKRDFDYLVRLYEGIVSRQDQFKAPAQLYQESNLVIRSIRDYFSAEMDEVLIDDDKVYKDAKDFFSLVMPELSHLLKQHRERRPIFSRYQIEEQIDLLAKNQIPLPSGGSIVIDQTEALVAIDVNSGKMASESGIEATAAKTNLEAAAEVGRQLRLRDLGGLIVIDFIDMRDRKNIREVEQELRKALKDDKAKVTVGRISQFGLLEMSRQRLKPTLSVGAYLECPHCQGKGRIKSAENQAVGLLRQIHAAASKGHIGHIEAEVPLDVANDLLNSKRHSLADLEKRLNLRVTIIARSDLLPGQIELELHKREKTEENGREILPVSHSNQIEIALAAAAQQEEEDVQQVMAEGDETVATEQPASQDDGERKGRRRRRRRRRKSERRTLEVSEAGDQQGEPSDASASAPETPAQVSEPAGSDITESQTAGDQSSSRQDETKPGAQAQTASDNKPAEEKPKRRTRRTSKKTAEGTTPDTAPAAEEKIAENQPAAAAEKPAEEKPKRRTRRTSKKTTEGTAPDAAAPTEEKTAEKQPAAAAEKPAEEKPKRRTRRTSKKTAEGTAPDAAAPTEEKTAEKQPAAAEKPAEEKPKRRTRRTSKKTAEGTTPDTAPAAEDKTAEKQPAAAEKPAEEKPKRRTRRTSKKSAEGTMPDTAPATEEKTAEKQPTAAAEKPAEEKPKRRTRRTSKKTAESTTPDTTPAAVEKTAEKQPAAATEKPVEEKPKRRPRRTSQKTAEGAETGTAATAKEKAAEGQPAAAEEKPKRRPGRPRKKTQSTDNTESHDS